MPTINYGEKTIYFPEGYRQDAQAAIDRDIHRTVNLGEAFEYETQDYLDALATSTMLTPIAGDISGMAADINMYATDPDSRNWFNYLFTAAGILPFVPAASQVRKARKTARKLNETNAKLARAKKAGFNTDATLYHGSSSTSPFSEFDPGRAGLVYFSEDPGYAKSYATGGLPVSEYYLKKGKQFDSVGNPKHKQKLIKMFNDKGGWELNAEMQGYDSAKDYFADSGQVGRKNFDYDARYDEDWEILDNLDTDVLADLQAEGFDSFRFQERSPSQEFPKGVVAQAVSDPSRVRSINAEFDPSKTKSGNLLASAAPVTTGLLGAAVMNGATNQGYEEDTSGI